MTTALPAHGPPPPASCFFAGRARVSRVLFDAVPVATVDGTGAGETAFDTLEAERSDRERTETGSTGLDYPDRIPLHTG